MWRDEPRARGGWWVVGAALAMSLASACGSRQAGLRDASVDGGAGTGGDGSGDDAGATRNDASSGGGSGGGGSGGSSVPPVHPCVGSLRAAATPVLADAMIECDDSGFGLQVGAGAGERAYVSFTTNGGALYPRLFTIEPPQTPQIDSAVIEASSVGVVTDASGAPYLVGSEVPNVGVGFYRRVGGAWTLEPVSTQPTSNEFFQAGQARFASDGRAFVAYSDGISSVRLGTRDTAGTWRRTDVGAGQYPLVVVDSLQRAHVIYLGTSAGLPGWSLFDWRDGAAVRVLWSKADALGSGAWAAPFGSGGLAATVQALDGAHVVIATGDGPAVTDVLVPDTQQVRATGCPSLTPCPSTAGSMTCSERGDGGLGLPAVATTSDGTLWFAHVLWHVDHDVTITTTLGEGVSCQSRVTADRSTTELVLDSVSANGQAPRNRWRAQLQGDPEAVLAIEAKGTRLLLAYMDSYTQGKTSIRYVVLDATQL